MRRSHRRPVESLAAAGLLALALSGCVSSHAGRPPLEFKDLQYFSLDAHAWPTRMVVLERVNATYGLPAATRLAVVELNPEGERTLVFLHGAGGYLKMWQHQLNHFAVQGYRVVALDLPGYGKSDKPALFPYTPQAMAEVVHDLAIALNLRRPVLVGHGLGARIALTAAIRWPEMIGGLVLTAPEGFERPSPAEQRQIAREAATTLAPPGGAPEADAWGAVVRDGFHRWRDAYEWLVDERVRLTQARDYDAHAYADARAVAEGAADTFAGDHLEKVAAPTFILFGALDRRLPDLRRAGGDTRDAVEAGRARIPGATSVELAACGHEVQIDCSTQYNQAVGDFLTLLGR